MDLPVVLIKIRDYLFWFGPAYIVAITLGAATEVILRRLLKLPSFVSFAGTKEVPLGFGLLYGIWWRARGRPDGPQQVPLSLYIWLGVSSEALTWMSLLVTGALNPQLSVLRLGSALLMASLLATLVPVFIGASGTASDGTQVAIEADTSSPAPLLKGWWQALSERFSTSSNSIVLGAALGAGVIGLAPSIYSLLGRSLAAPPGYLAGPALGVTLGVLARVTPGADAPFLAALQARGVDIWAIIAIMLALSASPFSLIQGVNRHFGKRAAIVFLLVALVTAGALGMLIGLVVSLTGAS